MRSTFVTDQVHVHAPLERLWLLSTRVELVKETLGMRLVGGTTQGFIAGGSRVIWRGWKFGLPTEHHTLITAFEPPNSGETAGQTVAWFRDEQEKGRFAQFAHDHWFQQVAGESVTVLKDEVRFQLPWYLGGAFAARWIMRPYVRRLVKRRFARLKQLAEGEGWRPWLLPAVSTS